MRFTKKWMVVPFVEQQDDNENFSKLEKIIQSSSITDEEKINSYNNQFKKIINTQTTNNKEKPEDARLEKIKQDFEQLDKKRQEEIIALQQSINLIKENKETNFLKDKENDSFFRPTAKATRKAKKRRINADESVVLGSRYSKHLLKAPHKPNYGNAVAKSKNNSQWIHDDIHDLSNDISMININQ